jgi:hypothetical protein
LIAFVFIFTACAPLPAPSQPAPTQWLRVQVTPLLADRNELFSSCTPQGTGLVLQQATGTAFDPTQTDLRLVWGAQPAYSGYAAEIGHEELVLAVHPTNPLTSISLTALQTTFSGDLPGWDWDYLGQSALPLTAYTYPAASEFQAVLAESLLPTTKIAREVVVVPGPQEMRAALASDPGGLGFLPLGWVDSSVKTVAVDGLAPGSWARPILALSTSEPQGAAREWLICVQQGLK